MAGPNSPVLQAEFCFKLVDGRSPQLDPYLTTLDAQRSLYAAQRTRVAVELAEALNAVALYRSLGADNLIAG